MLLSVGKEIGLYLYIAQVDLERSSRGGPFCRHEIHDIGVI